MLVKDIMQADVVTISPLATLREAMDQMKRHKVKSLVVERRDEHDAYGIVTYTTILRTIIAEEGDIDLVNVYDVCTKPVITVPPACTSNTWRDCWSRNNCVVWWCWRATNWWD